MTLNELINKLESLYNTTEGIIDVRIGKENGGSIEIKEVHFDEDRNQIVIY